MLLPALRAFPIFNFSLAHVTTSHLSFARPLRTAIRDAEERFKADTTVYTVPQANSYLRQPVVQAAV